MRVTCQTGCSGAAWLPCEALTSKFHLDVMAQPDQSRYQWERIDPYKIGEHPAPCDAPEIVTGPPYGWGGHSRVFVLGRFA
jgi:hypothetical protein